MTSQTKPKAPEVLRYEWLVKDDKSDIIRVRFGTSSKGEFLELTANVLTGQPWELVANDIVRKARCFMGRVPDTESFLNPETEEDDLD